MHAMENGVDTKILKLIQDKRIIGIGTGTTIAQYINILPEAAIYIPSSISTSLLLSRNGLVVSTALVHEHIDLYIDGTDYFDGDANLIKGLGGALTKEKIICSASKQTVIIAQPHKYRQTFDGCFVPIEVIPMSLPRVLSIINKRGLRCSLREDSKKIGPVMTELGNCIVDVEYDKQFIDSCKSICGVVEHGLFESNGFVLMVEKDSSE
ncbi:ribose5-phosphate isomerase [Ordospora pajunii]|uniref:ribose5-phosphate isomerase n=1 Tax=Ordospora pajunii TaxID=3039483 RepID=UPI00295281C1|nr:ribose5-phosphate isomerase [Ordospora pajunii]KAH9411527.1 ribose5-phosphate isomerase [Ordospora pajunii]